MKKKILFVQPTIRDDAGRLVKASKLYFVGLSYPLLAALTPPGWEIEICLETIEEIPWETDASVIGIGGMGHAARRGLEIAREFRARGKKVIMGGPMVSLAPELAAEHCDAVVIGDADLVWPEVVRDLEEGTLKPRYRRDLTTLSSPVPRYELILGKRIGDFLPVQAGRGCPKGCTFCTIYCLYRTRYLRRPIDEVMRDLRHVRELGFRKFLLLDDNIVSDPEYARELFERIGTLGMTWMTQCAIDIARDDRLLKAAADSGCTTLSFGLESISPESLKRVNKAWSKPEEYRALIDKIVAAGIDVATEMMVGIDGDTRESLRATVDFVESTRISAPKFYIMTPIPGTDYYEEMKRSGRLVNEDVFAYSPSLAMIKHPNLATTEINALFWEIYDRLYSLRSILKRTVLHRAFLREPARYLFLLGVNLIYRRQIRRRIPPIIV